MNDEQIKKMMELSQKKIKNIETTFQNTILEFEDGEKMVLLGGQNMVGPIKQVPCCTYCGKEKSKKIPMISPDDRDDVMICSDCTLDALKLFVQSGIEIDIDLSYIFKKS